MALTNCRECGGEVSTEARACPKCGAAPKRARPWIWALVAAPVAFLLFGAVVGGTPEAKEQSGERRAIDLCWEEQQRKSIDPAQQRFIAGACEELEMRFQKKYGRKP